MKKEFILGLVGCILNIFCLFIYEMLSMNDFFYPPSYINLSVEAYNTLNSSVAFVLMVLTIVTIVKLTNINHNPRNTGKWLLWIGIISILNHIIIFPGGAVMIVAGVLVLKKVKDQEKTLSS